MKLSVGPAGQYDSSRIDDGGLDAGPIVGVVFGGVLGLGRRRRLAGPGPGAARWRLPRRLQGLHQRLLRGPGPSSKVTADPRLPSFYRVLFGLEASPTRRISAALEDRS